MLHFADKRDFIFETFVGSLIKIPTVWRDVHLRDKRIRFRCLAQEGNTVTSTAKLSHNL
jgi:hypothetical protein